MYVDQSREALDPNRTVRGGNCRGGEFCVEGAFMQGKSVGWMLWAGAQGFTVPGGRELVIVRRRRRSEEEEEE
jgi:hypothetical protein